MPATRSPRRCSRTASVWSAAASSITGRAASSRRVSRSRTRWSSLGGGARTEPNIRATQAELFAGLEATSQNRWPSLRLRSRRHRRCPGTTVPGRVLLQDLQMAVGVGCGYEPFIRRAAGLGRAPRRARSRSLREASTPLPMSWSQAADRPGWPQRSPQAAWALGSCWPTTGRRLGGSLLCERLRDRGQAGPGVGPGGMRPSLRRCPK